MILPGMDEFMKVYKQKTRRWYFKNLKRLKISFESVGLKSFSEVSKLTIRDFFLDLENEQLARSTKRKVYQQVCQYLRFLKEYDFIPEPLIPRTIPNFTDYVSPKRLKRISLRLPTVDDAMEILNHAKKANERMYIFCCLLFPNGMRASELLSTKIENINLDERYFLTGLEGLTKEEQEQKKMIVSKEGFCYYFIPKKLVNILDRYIKDLQSVYKKPVYLFHSTNTKTGYMRHQNAARNLKKYVEILSEKGIIIKCRSNPHAFRDSLNFERLKLGLNDSVMAILLNQVPRGTNAQFYLKQIKNNIEARRDYWDKFTPDYM